MSKLCAAVLFFIISSPLFATSVLSNNIELYTKLNLFAATAGIPNNFLPKYKQASIRFDINFAYRINENLSLNFLPYVQNSYNVNRQSKTKTQARIWQAYIKYDLPNFNFNLGRFDFVDKALSPFIYYGNNLPKDLALPTALDGVKHSFTGKYLDYTVLAAQEAQIDEYKKAKTAVAKVTAKPLPWLNISGFYFYQNKKYPQNINKINSKLSIYGAGAELFFSESSGLRFYGAKNGGKRQTIRPLITQEVPYKGYAFNGEIYFKNTYKAGNLNNKLGFYLFSDKEKFYAFPNKLQTGIIYGGMNYDNILPSSPQIIYAILDFNFKKYPHLYTTAGIFVYSSGKENFNNRNYYAKELNLSAGLKFDTWGLKLSGGLFEGEALFFGGTSAEKQKIKKLQANFFYKFSL